MGEVTSGVYSQPKPSALRPCIAGGIHEVRRALPRTRIRRYGERKCDEDRLKTGMNDPSERGSCAAALYVLIVPARSSKR